MIFLTVGTQFPFDRLVRSIDELVGNGTIAEGVFAQIGDSTYSPRHFEFVKALDKDMYEETLRRSSAVISHAGMGSITMACDYGKPLLVMPRLARYKEVVNDHQVGIAIQYAEMGLILVANDESELPRKLEELAEFTPKRRVHQAGQVASRIRDFLEKTRG